MILRRLGLHAVVLGTLLTGTMACVPTGDLTFGYLGFNERLRPDRAPLSQEQTALTGNLDRLRYGPYRAGLTELAVPLRPAHEFATNLPQSDCWWMGQSATGGRDSLRANWEEIVVVTGDEGVLEKFHDEEDMLLDVGLCRLNDPETRAFLHNRNDDSTTTADVDCQRIGNSTAVTQGVNNHFINCTSDTQWLDVQLLAFRTTATDALMRCPNLLAGFNTVDRKVRRATDFYDGLSGGPNDNPIVEACANDRLLIPETPTRYRVQQSENNALWLDPAVIPVGTASLGRQMAAGTPANVWAWSTIRTFHVVTLAPRWEENFSPSIRVSKVRFFDLNAAGNRVYLSPTGRPPLCIEDPDAQAGCRWTCQADTAADGALEYNLLQSNRCTLASGASEIPRVTPTYADSTHRSRVLDQPLRWSAQFANATPPFIELQLITVFEPAALRAAPALTGLEPARVGQYSRGSFMVENVGGHPMRVTSVAMDAAHGGNAAGDFTLQLPALPVPETLPIEYVDRGTKESTVTLSSGAESQATMTLFSDFAHLRVGRRGGGFSANTGNHVVRDDHGLLLRDVVNPVIKHDARVTPAARTSWALRTLPFVIQPGERFEVSVRARPGATGDRIGYARIVAESALNPAQRVTIWDALQVFGMQGPLISAAPGQLVFSVNGTGVARDRAVLIQNAGDTTGAIGAPTLTAIGGGPLPADSQLRVDDPYGGAGSLASGDSRVIHIDYLSDCSRNVVGGYRDEDAELRWTTPDGPVVVRIDTAADCVP